MNQKAPATSPRLELRNVSKRYPGGVLANDDVGLAVMPGEIHALLGENGAGKSTLVKIIYGVLQADAGAIRWNGREVTIASPKAARALGIGMVFQHFSLFEAMTVLENIALGVDQAGDLRALAARIVEVSRTYGLPLDPRRHVHTLSVGERQRIEIVRCLLQNPKLLIMDEPTSVLTPQEVELLFATLRQLAGRGLLDPVHQPQARGDQGAVPPRDHPAPGPGGRRMRSGAGERAQHGRADDRQRARRHLPATAAPHRRAAPGRVRPEPAGRATVRHRSAARSRSRCAAARSSASPGSPATARPSCSRRSRASARSRGRRSSGSTAARSDTSAPRRGAISASPVSRRSAPVTAPWPT